MPLAAGGDFGGLTSVILNTLLGFTAPLAALAALAAGGDFGGLAGLTSVILNTLLGLTPLATGGDFDRLVRLEGLDTLDTLGRLDGLTSVILNTLTFLTLIDTAAAGGDFGGLGFVGLTSVILNTLNDFGDFLFNGILNLI